MMPYLVNRIKSSGVLVPSGNSGVWAKFGFSPFVGFEAGPFYWYYSKEKADTGAKGAIFVASICLFCRCCN
jgi:hypothetical protein